ncbi:MAG: flagellar hook-basal body protein [Nitrospirae bacterium]|nr:flagellar hook-basal body protein [Nitrospirota bacterium]
MYKGIYVAMTGAMLRDQELDNVANNLANANTTGYKRTSFSARLYPLLEGKTSQPNAIYPDSSAMTSYGQYSMDTTQGEVRETRNPLDLALVGDGYFAVQSKDKTYYTRNGSFSLSKESFLVDASGQQILNTSNKPIYITGSTIQITGDGTIFADGNEAGKLKLVKLDPASIQHIGSSMLSGTETGASDAKIHQGSLEMSNVNPIKEMVGIINASRNFEAAQTVIKNFDTLAEKTVTEIARV